MGYKAVVSQRSYEQIQARLAESTWVLAPDQFSRDLFTLGHPVWGRDLLFMSLAVILLPSISRIILGGIAGYFGGVIDLIRMLLCHSRGASLAVAPPN